MSARELVLGMNGTLQRDAGRGGADRDRSGNAMPRDGARATPIAACRPTLLELYRQDPCAVRKEIERQAGRERGEAIFKSLARIFS